MLPRPPTSLFFPYTTLFRSHKAPSIKVAEAAKVIENAQRDLNIAFMNELSAIFQELDIDTKDVHESEDRKSTRLNSSHLGISYAVFCLKKKKSPQDNTTKTE